MKHQLISLLLVVALTAATVPAIAAVPRPRPCSVRVSHRKELVVRIAPNPVRTGKLSVSSLSKTRVDFYVFDQDGTLMHQLHLMPGSKEIITTLPRGMYSYDVFRNDEGVERGSIVVLR